MGDRPRRAFATALRLLASGQGEYAALALLPGIHILPAGEASEPLEVVEEAELPVAVAAEG